ncbi:MAG: bifunctional phosphopantothenoylcysteine decarboxylase/phosphopantothenate--cysteine ligase CoaBC [Bacteriovoracia bacterium]
MNILLGISGSIAAYKAFDLTRSLVKKGHAVRVVLTHGALEFVRPELFRYLGAEAAYLPTDDFNAPTPGVPHVDFAKWADVLAIAPLSANTLAKLAQGQCADFLGSIFLAWRQNRPVLMFPAMNTMMWEHEFTQAHVAKINKLPFAKVVSPDAGLLACGDVGSGKLMDVDGIADLIECYNPLLANGKSVLITTGATVAPLDPVRFMTNPSSGLTGVELARAYLKRGTKVTLLAGHPVPAGVAALSAHPSCKVIETPTTQQMLTAALAEAPHASTIIAAAAVADFEFHTAAGKLKKDQLTELPVVRAVDILAELLKQKKPGQKFVSFAAETETTEAVFREKFNRKPVDLMIGNRVHSGFLEARKREGFAESRGTYWLVTKDQIQNAQALSKAELAAAVVRWDETGVFA